MVIVTLRDSTDHVWASDRNDCECEGRVVIRYSAKQTVEARDRYNGRDMREEEEKDQLKQQNPYPLRPEYPFATPLTAMTACLPHAKTITVNPSGQKKTMGEAPTVDHVMGAPRRDHQQTRASERFLPFSTGSCFHKQHMAKSIISHLTSRKAAALHTQAPQLHWLSIS